MMQDEYEQVKMISTQRLTWSTTEVVFVRVGIVKLLLHNNGNFYLLCPTTINHLLMSDFGAAHQCHPSIMTNCNRGRDNFVGTFNYFAPKLQEFFFLDISSISTNIQWKLLQGTVNVFFIKLHFNVFMYQICFDSVYVRTIYWVMTLCLLFLAKTC